MFNELMFNASPLLRAIRKGYQVEGVCHIPLHQTNLSHSRGARLVLTYKNLDKEIVLAI